ncbi:hypothetical protein [Stenotrophomonas sp. GD03657]|uniref:hypothetical protein n=1 Tax=Stenotrophomonas sp. GD03657 TaxID=2975363 RepID=UPI00244B9FD6|nr:hypothetical protein [Stenotrophomonas sp. GD03657]MDH2154134.1 hypothetical protein [Stenotrophomonas sp. GD03657]
MNAYLFTLRSPSRESVRSPASVIDTMLPTRSSVMYTHFLLDNGLIDCPSPMAISWWADAPIREPAAMLVPWGVKSREEANRLTYLTQLLAGPCSGEQRLLMTRALQEPAIDEKRPYIESVGRFIGEMQRRGGEVSYTYSARDPHGFGALIGLTFDSRFESWIRESIERNNHG